MILFVFLLMNAAAEEQKPTDWLIPMSNLMDNKILGGRKAIPGEFPWAVSFRLSRLPSSSGHYCGGSILTTNVVITACHCGALWDSYTNSLRLYPIYDKLILAGSLESDLEAKGGQIRMMKQMVIHPKCAKDPFENRGFLFDYAYAVVEEPFVYNERLKPVKLFIANPNEAEKHILQLVSKRVKCQSSGFGFTKADEEHIYYNPSRVLKAIDLNIVNNNECRKLLCDTYESYCNISLTSKLDICAVSPVGGDVCKGDSGSSLICDGRAVGITSWGPRCGEDKGVEIPSMYARVDATGNFFNLKHFSDEEIMRISNHSDRALGCVHRSTIWTVLLATILALNKSNLIVN